MPYTSLSKAKEAGAITTFQKKPISLSALNKLYSIYDGIKDDKKVKNPMAIAMSTWKGTVELQNGVWTLKAQKKESKTAKKSQIKEAVGGYPVSNTGVKGLKMPAGSAKIGNGSMESFRSILRDALKELFGKESVYIIATYQDKVVIEAYSDDGKENYYEISYTIKDGVFSFGTPVKVVKITSFQKQEQKAFKDYRESVKKLASGKVNLCEVVKLGLKVSRVKI